MTEDTSSENLRKFLESDDPAIVMMGLSMAKGSGLPEEVLPTILRFYMWDDDITIRAAAKSVFNKHASKELKEKVKESWKPNYRTLPMGGDKFPKVISSLVERFGPQDDFVLYPVIKELENFDWYKGEIKANVAATLLGQIGDKRAIRPLIKALKTYPLDFGTEIGDTGSAPIIDALKIIGGDKAVEALIKALYKREQRAGAARALGKMGDVSAVKPLIQTLKKSDNSYDRGEIIEALGNLKSKEASEILIKYLSSQNEYQQELVAIALGKIGDKRAVEPLIKTLGELHKRDNRIYDDDDFRDAAIDALKKLGHMTEDTSPENLRKFDGSDIKIGPSGEISINEVMHLEKMSDSHAIGLLIKSLENGTTALVENPDYTLFTGSAVFPRAEVSTGTRTKCLASDTTIQEGELRIAVEKVSLDSDLAYYINVGFIRATYFEDYFRKKSHDSSNPSIILQRSEVRPAMEIIRDKKREFPYERPYPSWHFFLDTDNWENTVHTLLENSLHEIIIRNLPHFDDIWTAHRKKTYRPLAKERLHELNELFGKTIASYNHIMNALVKITEKKIKEKEKKNIIKFLESDDKAMVMMGASMLKGILEK